MQNTVFDFDIWESRFIARDRFGTTKFDFGVGGRRVAEYRVFDCMRTGFLGSLGFVFGRSLADKKPMPTEMKFPSDLDDDPSKESIEGEEYMLLRVIETVIQTPKLKAKVICFDSGFWKIELSYPKIAIETM